MSNIRDVYVSDENILVISTDSKVWIMGDNHDRKTGFGEKHDPLYAPVFTKIILDPEEQIKKFHSYGHTIIIYTTKGRLFCSNNLYRSDSHRSGVHNGSLLGRPIRIRGGDHGSSYSSDDYSNDNSSDTSDSYEEEYTEDNDSDDGTDYSDGEDENTGFEDIIEGANSGNSGITSIGLSSWPGITTLLQSIQSVGLTPSPNIDLINGAFFDKMYRKHRNGSKTLNHDPGYTLFAENVTDAVISFHTIIFRKDNKIYFFDESVTICDAIVQKKLGLSAIFIDNGPLSYYELIMPFDATKFIFCEDFVWGQIDTYYHLLYSAIDVDENSYLTWAYFKFDVELLPQHIHINVGDNTIYIQQDSKLYKYVHQNHTIIPYNNPVNCGLEIKNMLLKDNNEKYIYLFRITSEGLFLDIDQVCNYEHCAKIEHQKICADNELLMYAIDINSFGNHHFILIDSPFAPKYRIIGTSLFFNVNDLLFYKLNNSGLIYYDNTNTLYYCTTDTLESDEYNTIEIDKITVKNRTYYIYMFSDINIFQSVSADSVQAHSHTHLELPVGRTSLCSELPVGRTSLCSELPVGRTSLCSELPVGRTSLCSESTGLNTSDESLVIAETKNITKKSKGKKSKNKSVTGSNPAPIANSISAPIDDIKFTDNLIVIKSGTRYAFHTINTDQFVVDKFTEIILDVSKEEELPMVIKSHIIYQKKKFDFPSVEMFINNESRNKFQKLLNIMELIRDNSDFTIKYVDKDKIISYGDGPKREFLEVAILDFAEKFLVQKNVCTQFNYELLDKFTPDELYCIGLMLHAVISHNKNHLPFRLPISILKALKKFSLSKHKSNKSIDIVKLVSLTKEELEYFARIENPEIFNNVKPYRNDKIGFTACESNFETYEDLLNNLCGESGLDPTLITTINDHIARGILTYTDIKNLHTMNYPTLDYYLSGDYVIDRTTIIKNLAITSGNNLHKVSITNIIKNLPEHKLAILLQNWSGTSVVKKSYVYTISITKKHTQTDILFATCSITIHIAKKLLDKPQMNDILIDLLCTPITTMVDE